MWNKIFELAVFKSCYTVKARRDTTVGKVIDLHVPGVGLIPNTTYDPLSSPYQE